MKPRILLIDNNDSFTYNLVQIIRETGTGSLDVRSCKDIGLNEIIAYDKVLISPGPGTPSEYPVLTQLILKYKDEKSILGICLGHQAIAEAFGLKLYNMGKVCHGIQSMVILSENAGDLFQGVPGQFCVGLYHSWAVYENDPKVFQVTARTREGVIMGLSHIRYDIQGVQFHPESYMTEYGKIIITNWLKKKKVASYEATF